MRNGLSESFIPKEIREVYIIFVGFWASYIFGNILFLSTSSDLVIFSTMIGGLCCIYIAVVGSSFFDNYATRNGSLPHYLFAIMLWSIMCMAIHMGVNRLDFSAQPPFTLHIWIGVLIYLIRVVATELCVVFEKIY